MNTLFVIAVPQMAIEGLSPGEFSNEWMYRGYRLLYEDWNDGDNGAMWMAFLSGHVVECDTLCCAKWEIDYYLDGEPDNCPDPIHRNEVQARR